MKKYIKQIIEIVLEDVSCEHQEIEEYPHGPKFDDPTYFLNDENAVIEKCIKAILAKIDHIFIGKKARELFGWSADPRTIAECEGFIRSVLKGEE